MHKSLWSAECDIPHFNSLQEDIKTDVLVIGGGLCGILCAYFLKQSGIDCTVVEKTKIACGTTHNTTAKITSLHGLVYDDLLTSNGKECAQKYFDINERAISKYKELCTTIDCEFKVLPAYTYSLRDLSKIEAEVSALELLGADAELVRTTSLPFDVAGAVCVKNQAQFHPLKFIKYIVKDLNIYENTNALQVTPEYVLCDKAKIFPKKIIVATHFPFINKHGSYFFKLYQDRSYVLALENAQDVNGMYIDEADGGLSFRNSKNLLLLGGCGNRTGKPCGGWNELEKFAKKYYPDSKIKYRWATQDCMSLDKIPYIGQYSKNTPNMFVATGFNKWGITSSMVSAMILTDLIQGKTNDYADIFSPSRNILKPQLLKNCAETFSNYVHPTTRRCPHLGCALTWNRAEHTWDCSCHGSRFEKDGSVISNPATKDADI